MTSKVRPWKRFNAVAAVATRRWLASRTSLLAAALAFHALLALAPILLVLLAVAAPVLGEEATQRSLAEAAVRFAGPRADDAVSALLDMTSGSRGRMTGTLVGGALMLFFASTFFARFQMALDLIWQVQDKPLGQALVARAMAFGRALLAVAVMLLVLAAGVARSIVAPLLVRFGTAGDVAWTAWTRVGTLLITSLILAAVFRCVPSVRPRPRAGAVFAGAIPGALALNLANEVLGYVIGKSTVVSLYGAAGTPVVVLLWVYYSVCVVLLGAELCRAWDEAAPRTDGIAGPSSSRS